MSLFTRLRRWIADAFRKPLVGVSVDELPDLVEGGAVYLIGDSDFPWSAALVCPCGCSETIQLSLIPDDRPRWKATHHPDSTISLEPSVWRTKGCRSHFILRRGRVVWAKDLPQQHSARRLHI
jgi:hypothetical protein